MKASVHKITLYVIDHDGIGVDEVCDVLANANYPNDCIYPCILSAETADAGEWSDDHPLNKHDTASAEIDRLFAVCQGERP